MANIMIIAAFMIFLKIEGNGGNEGILCVKCAKSVPTFLKMGTPEGHLGDTSDSIGYFLEL